MIINHRLMTKCNLCTRSFTLISGSFQMNIVKLSLTTKTKVRGSSWFFLHGNRVKHFPLIGFSVNHSPGTPIPMTLQGCVPPLNFCHNRGKLLKWLSTKIFPTLLFLKDPKRFISMLSMAIFMWCYWVGVQNNFQSLIFQF